jgi:hypothetical protein
VLADVAGEDSLFAETFEFTAVPKFGLQILNNEENEHVMKGVNTARGRQHVGFCRVESMMPWAGRTMTNTTWTPKRENAVGA